MKSTLLAFIGLLLPVSAGAAGTSAPLADAQMDMVSAGQFDAEGYAAATGVWTANLQSQIANWIPGVAACALIHCGAINPPPPLPSPPQPNQFLHIDLPR